MDILLSKSVLVQALQIITPITDKSSTKPILSNFLLTSEGVGENQVEFSATDYEISIRGRFPVTVNQSGSICVSAKKLLDICKEFREETISIRSDDQKWVMVESGPSKLRLPTMEIGLYPRMESVKLSQSFRMEPKALRQTIERTKFAIQTNESRKTLMGVCLNISNGHTARWTTTDGHRLAQVMLEVDQPQLNAPPEIIIPRKALEELSKVAQAAQGPVDISFDERTLTAKAGQLELTTRLIEGKFPNVDPIIPRGNPRHVVAERDRLLSTLTIISLMSGDKIKPVKLNLEAGNIRLESEKSEVGEVSDELPVEYAGESVQVGFNASYLLDVLKVLDGAKNVQMELNGPLNPCLIHVPGDDSFLSVVMPLRIEW
ncbi:MAG: DNA polymerase III subunit beta [Deltaproteobacteria bacterium]|nr:DNA polymerase III subunit beta [Deltaproteobacteria bacterium]